MAQSRDYQVKLYPAHAKGGFVTTTYEIFGDTPYPEKQIAAAGMIDLVDQVEDFAMEHGEGCQASVRCLDGDRKPPGFKRATSDLYYNLQLGTQDDAQNTQGDAAATSGFFSKFERSSSRGAALPFKGQTQ